MRARFVSSVHLPGRRGSARCACCLALSIPLHILKGTLQNALVLVLTCVATRSSTASSLLVVAFTFLYEAARRPRGIGHGKKQGSSSALDAACTAKAESEDEETYPGLGRVGVVARPWVTALIL